MTTGQFDIVLGGHDADVTAFNGGSIGSSGVRVIVDDTNCRKKEDAIQGINYILNRIKEGTWPPTIFSPLSLFAAGEQGAWYDPSDMTTLFQDSAGTVPVTASGDPVGLMLDKSGRGNHAAQATAGSRPTFRDVGGLRYLEFDGSNDFLLTGSINFTATDDISVFAGLRKLSDATTGVVVELSADTASNPGSFALTAPNFTAEASFGFRINTTASMSIVRSGFVAPVSAALTGTASSSVSSNFRVNGASMAGAAPAAGNYGNYPIYIGRRGGASLPFNGHLYGLAVRGAISGASSISSMEAYMANKTGITLP